MHEPTALDHLEHQVLCVIQHKSQIVDPYTALAAAVDLAYGGRINDAYQTCKFAQVLADRLMPDQTAFIRIWDAVMGHAVWCGTVKGREVSGIHERFRTRIAGLIPGGVIVFPDRDLKHRPDFFVSVDDSAPIPVELKRGSFDANAVKQLARYMRVYGATQGYAVAPKLTATLRPGMRFVELA